MIFNGVDLEQYFEDDFIVKEVRGRTITQNELETLSIPLADGEVLMGSKIPPKVLEVDIALNANTKRDLNKKIDELNSIIHTKETVPITFKDEPDMTYYGILGTSKEDPEEANVHEATLNIMVLDGLKYGPLREIKVVRNLLGTDGNFKYDSDGNGIGDGWVKVALSDEKFYLNNGWQYIETTTTNTFSGNRVQKTGLNIGRYLLVLVKCKTDGISSCEFRVSSAGSNIKSKTYKSTAEKTLYIKFDNFDKNMWLQLFNLNQAGVSGWVAFSDVRIYEIDEETHSKIDADPEYTGDRLIEKFPYIEPPQTMFLQSGLKETITYAGTAPVIPEIEIIPSEKTTYAGYTNGEKSVLVGYPIDVETMPYDKEPIFFNNVMSDRSNWTDATSMHEITVGGSYSTSSYGLFPIAYGTGTSWHGPSVIRTLNEALTDFTLSTYIGLANTSLSQMSKLEWHLLSADNEIQARILFGDFWTGYNRSVAEFYIGNPANEKKIQLLDDRWTKDFKGVVQLRKEGNRIELYVARTAPSPHHQIKKTVFIDTENRFSKPIAKIQLATCQWGANPTADPRYIQILLRKINPIKDDMIPYIADVGDKITIDKALNVRKNDQLQLGLNVFSEPIELKKGENTLIALPPTADVTVRFREVFK